MSAGCHRTFDLCRSKFHASSDLHVPQYHAALPTNPALAGHWFAYRLHSRFELQEGTPEPLLHPLIVVDTEQVSFTHLSRVEITVKLFLLLVYATARSQHKDPDKVYRFSLIMPAI